MSLAPQPSQTSLAALPVNDPRWWSELQQLPDRLGCLRESILANLVMIGEIPAPTGEEPERVRFILDRFVEAGLSEAATDDAGNAVGFLPGTEGERNIMLVAHLDTIVASSVDHTVEVRQDRVVGAGVSDNSLGAAVIAVLPACLRSWESGCDPTCNCSAPCSRLIAATTPA